MNARRSQLRKSFSEAYKHMGVGQNPFIVANFTLPFGNGAWSANVTWVYLLSFLPLQIHRIRMLLQQEDSTSHVMKIAY